jgi:hypothetical protein
MAKPGLAPKPRPPQEIILCACPCKQPMEKYDRRGKVRTFIKGHHLYRKDGLVPSPYEGRDGHLHIPLPRGKETICDLQEKQKALPFTWHAQETNHTTYAVAHVPPDLRSTLPPHVQGNAKISLHQLVMGFPPPPLEVDHLNHNGLDNRRANLEIKDDSGQSANRRGVKRLNLTPFRGVFRKRARWMGKVASGGKEYKAYFASQIEAAAFYNITAHAVFNGKSILNIFTPAQMQWLRSSATHRFADDELACLETTCVSSESATGPDVLPQGPHGHETAEFVNRSGIAIDSAEGTTRSVPLSGIAGTGSSPRHAGRRLVPSVRSGLPSAHCTCDSASLTWQAQSPPAALPRRERPRARRRGAALARTTHAKDCHAR